MCVSVSVFSLSLSLSLLVFIVAVSISVLFSMFVSVSFVRVCLCATESCWSPVYVMCGMQISNPRALVVSGGVWQEVGERARSRIGKLERTSGERIC